MLNCEVDIVPNGQSTMDRLLNAEEHKFIMFSLTSCGFCWAARRLFDAMGIPFLAVDLDSAEYREQGLGREIRAALLKKTGSATVPQIFVGGEFIGGCTDAFEANETGELQRLLKKHQVPFNEGEEIDGRDFLPYW